MSKPIQIAAYGTRGESEQYGHETVYCLCDDGEIYCHDDRLSPLEWRRVTGPWMDLVSAIPPREPEESGQEPVKTPEV